MLVCVGGSNRVVTVPISGNIETDIAALQEHGPVDVYFDISPKLTTTPSYIKASMTALRRHGRMSIMGGIPANVEFPYPMIMFKGLTIKGTFMYTREQADELIKLVETGLLPIGQHGGIQTTGKYPLSMWQQAFEHAYSESGPRKAVYFIPNGE